MIALLGQPPQALLHAGKSSQKFFTDKGKLDVPNLSRYNLFFVTNEAMLILQGNSAQIFHSQIACLSRERRPTWKGKVKGGSSP